MSDDAERRALIDEWFTGDLHARLRALADTNHPPSEQPGITGHICGTRGWDPMRDETCPGCARVPEVGPNE